MKILITGITGLAESIANVYTDHLVASVGRYDGFDINNVDSWGYQFIDYDIVFNCAYDGFAQIKILEFFYNAWKEDSTKTIVTIGSKAVCGKRANPDIDDTQYWSYRVHKQALLIAHDTMNRNTKCNMKIINPGPIDTNMIRHHAVVKMNPNELAAKIRQWVDDPYIKRVDIWP